MKILKKKINLKVFGILFKYSEPSILNTLFAGIVPKSAVVLTWSACTRVGSAAECKKTIYIPTE